MTTRNPALSRQPDGTATADAPVGIGHNGGPPLGYVAGRSWRRWRWRRAHRKAWTSPPREVVLRRLRRARAAGMSYHDYVLEIMERGRYL